MVDDSNKLPPQNQEAEQSVLGSILLDPACISLITEDLKTYHFYYKENSIIFDVMMKLYQENKPIDILTLSHELKKESSYKESGGKDYLSQLIEIVPTSANVEHYARVVKECSIRRQIITIGSDVVRKAFTEEGEVGEMINKVESEIFALSQQSVKRDFIHLKEILTESYERLEEVMKSGEGMRGVPTGYNRLDHKLAGLNAANLVILAARPSIGKTTFALNIAANICLQSKKAVGMFSLEMSKEELVDRLLVMEADIDSWKLRTGRLDEDEMGRLTEALGRLSEANLFIDDTPGISITEMRTKARRLKHEGKLDVLIMDYLQLADSGRRFDSRVQEVSYVSQNLKNIARELQIPVLALSQLSRQVEQRGEKRPQLSDLRDSGAIEQDADVVMFIYRTDDEVGGESSLMPEGKHPVKVYIAKHRNGATGEIDYLFRADRLKFFEMDTREEL